MKKSLLTELAQIKEELSNIKKQAFIRMILEGVDDPGILKLVFLGGGPASGKSFVGGKLLGFLDATFGVDDARVKKISQSFSDSGLKVVSSDRMFEKMLKDNGINPKDLARIEKEEPELWDKIKNSIRPEAKRLTAAQERFFAKGRLGLMIDGTAKDPTKIKDQKRRAHLLGYDTYMVFINTDLKTALENNRNRPRVLPDDIVTDFWHDCQKALSTYHSMFGGNLIVVDNSLDSSGKFKPIDSEIQKAINSFINAPIKNQFGKKWIDTTRILKKVKLIDY